MHVRGHSSINPARTAPGIAMMQLPVRVALAARSISAASSCSRQLHQHVAPAAVAPLDKFLHPHACSCCSVHDARSLARKSMTKFQSVTLPSTASFSSSSSGPLMNAQVLTKAAPKFEMGLEQLRRPQPKRGEVLVKVRAAGVCHTDLHVMKAEIGFPIPAVMGHELSGEIVALGEGVSVHSSVRLKVGQKVASSFIMPCGECDFCVKGSEDLCATFFAYNRGKGQLYDGTTRLARPDGTPIAMYSFAAMAEYAVVPATAVYPLPQNASFVDSAIIGCAVFTAYGAVRNAAKLQPGENVAVIGVGGVGANILQLARAGSADRIIAVDVSDEKLQLARSLGATHTVNALKENVLDRIRAFTDARGVDVAFEALGRRDTFAQAVNSVADGGRAVMVGIAPAGVTAEVEITRLVRRKIQILGSYGAKARTDMPAILRMVEKGQLDLSGAISRRFSLAQAGEAYRLLDQGGIVGRAVIDMEI